MSLPSLGPTSEPNTIQASPVTAALLQTPAPFMGESKVPEPAGAPSLPLLYWNISQATLREAFPTSLLLLSHGILSHFSEFCRVWGSFLSFSWGCRSLPWSPLFPWRNPSVGPLSICAVHTIRPLGSNQQEVLFEVKWEVGLMWKSPDV